jgi:alpha-1,2-mannosyltransferase
MMSDLVWGNISTVVLAATVIAFFVVPQKYRGTITGLMAAVKIYPLIFVAWWAWRKRWAEVRSALIACFTLTALATALWWDSAYRFFATQVFGGGVTQRFHGPSLNSSSIFTLFSRPPFHSGDVPLWLVGVISALLLVFAFR